MKKSRIRLIILIFIIHLLSGFQQLKSQSLPLKREFRGVWIATISNIDWPSKKNLPVEDQKKELIEMLDKLKEAGINTVLFQVRPECDAFYESSIEPWSYWLTGEQGKAPDPFYDPLEFAITEAHKRCMELHTWLNPFRAVSSTNNYTAAEMHITNLHPEWILKFGELKILNPGIPEVKNYILTVVEDIVKRYDIDGIHFDDYFYPYTPIKDEDSVAFRLYKGNFSNIHDWRRNNINSFIAEVHKLIDSLKPNIKFGISPFGIVENKYTGTSGFESFKTLYCDPLYWLDQKIVDYVSPQLYWEIGHKSVDYAKLLPWWASVKNGRHLYIGHLSSRIADEKYTGNKSEIGNQLRLNKIIKNIDGDIFFSARSIELNFSGLADSMKFFWYEYTALPPLMSWKDTIPPLPPTEIKAEKVNEGIRLEWNNPDSAEDGDYPNNYLIYRFINDEEINLNDVTKILKIIPTEQNEFTDNISINENRKIFYVITSLDRLWNESKNYSINEVK